MKEASKKLKKNIDNFISDNKKAQIKIKQSNIKQIEVPDVDAKIQNW